MPKGSSKSRFDNIAKEGAKVTIEEVNYDDCVRMAAAEAAQTEHGVIVQDTAWDGYEEIPSWIMQGYGTMANEAADQLRQCSVNRPTHVFVQAGVGSLAGAVVGYFANLFPNDPPKFVVMEAKAADCLYRGRGEMQNKTEARRMWRTAADHGEVLAMLSLGEDCAARGEAGKALLYYRKARQTAQGMPDIEYTPRICLRLAQAETRYVSAKKAMALAAEAAQGFAILAREKEPDAAELQAEAEQLLRELADPKPRNTAYNIDSLQLD